MNQILRSHQEHEYNINNNNYNQNKYNNYNNGPKRRKNNYSYGNKAEMHSIIKVFCLVLILFGIIIIGKSVFALTSNSNNIKDHPQVTTDKMGREVTIEITTQKPIKQFSYKWNEGTEKIIEGNGTITISETIEVPNGNNILNIQVIDFYGNKTYYKKQYIYESTDVTKPTIDIASLVNSKISIIVEDETKLYYMTYKWNDEQETRKDAQEGNNKIEVEIDPMAGENTLTVTAVDSEGNKNTINKKVIGDNAPEISFNTMDNYVQINAKDDEGIKLISVTIDGKTEEKEINQKELNAKVQLTRGTHSIIVKVINVNGISSTKKINATL